MGNIVMFMPAGFNKTKSDNKKGNYYKNEEAMRNLMSYLVNPKKTNSAYIGGNYLCLTDIEMAVKQIKKVQKVYEKTSGRKMYHFILTFNEMVQDAEVVMIIADIVAKKYFSEYQLLYVVHFNTENLHIHFVFSSVSIETGKKFNMRKAEYKELVDGIETLALDCLKEWGIIRV